MKKTMTRRRRRLSAKQRNFLKAKLLEKRRQLLAQLADGLSRTSGGHVEGAGSDLLDLAQDNEDRDSAYQMVEFGSTAVEQIENAIQKMDEGSYGICESCGEPIPAARLRALPSATYCVKCKEAMEAGETWRDSYSYGRIVDIPDDSYDPETVYGSVRGTRVT